jgi:hypothetical protein
MIPYLRIAVIMEASPLDMLVIIEDALATSIVIGNHMGIVMTVHFIMKNII